MNHQGPGPNGSEESLFEFGDTVNADSNQVPGNDLEATLLRVQRAMTGKPEVSDDMPDDLKHQTWEKVMASTNANTMNQLNVLPGLSSNGPVAGPTRSAGAPIKRVRWTGAANVAVVLLMLLGSVAAWIAFDGSARFGNGGGDETTTIPGVAMQAATPESQMAAVATPKALTSCDLSQDIPYFPDVEQSPIDATSLYLAGRDSLNGKVTGDLMLHCASESQDTALASNVWSAGAGPWPGIVSLYLLPEGETDIDATYPAYLNLASRAIVEFGRGDDSGVKTHFQAPGNPWVVGPSKDDESTSIILDLRTMEHEPLSSLVGAALPEDAQFLAGFNAATPSLALTLVKRSGNTLKILGDSGLPGTTLIIEDKLEESRWISLPTTEVSWDRMWLSPDGTRLAYADLASDDSSAPIPDQFSYVVVSTGDGSEMARSDLIPYRDNPFVMWTQNGSAIAYVSGNTLETLASEPGSQARSVFESEQPLGMLQSTYDPNVVVVSTLNQDPAASPDLPYVYRVNVATGEMQQFPGVDASNIASWITQSGFLVMYQPLQDTPETMDYSVLNPVTGQEVGTISDVPYHLNSAGTFRAFGPNSVSLSRDGTTEAVAFDTQHIYLIRHSEAGDTVRQIETPESYQLNLPMVSIFLSPDGSQLSMSADQDEGRNRELIDLGGDEDSWTEVPNTVPGDDIGYIQFVEGLGDQSS